MVKFSRLQTKHIFPITTASFCIIAILALLFPGHGFTDYDFALITVAAFIFGIFITFSILSNQDKLNKVNELLKTHDANFLILYKLTNDFDSKLTDKFRTLLDNHMIEEIDYRLIDFNMSADTFYIIYDFISGLNPKTDKQLVIYDKMLDVLNDTVKGRQQIESITRQKVSRYEWFSILTLLTVITYLLLHIDDGSILSTLLSTILITPMIMLTLVLQTLNNLRWEEESQIWEQLHKLFLNLDLLPYYPEVVIIEDRYIPEGPGKVRIAQQPDVYPDMTNKKIIIKDIKDLPNLERSW